MHIIWFILCLFASYPVMSCELNVRLEQYAPESVKNIDNNWFGIDMDLTQALLTQASCKFKVYEISWARSLVMLAKGDIDMVLNMSKTPERETLFYFIGPIRQEVIVLATHKDSELNLLHIEDLYHLKKPIAVQRNAYYGEHIQNLITNKDYAHMFIFVTDNETKLAQLNRGRIIGFLEAKRNIVHGVKNIESFKNVSYQPLVLHQNPVYFAFSKKSVNHSLYLKIKSAFDTLVIQGTIAEIKQ